LPSLVPTLWRLRGGAAVELGAGYFLVWTLVGALLFPLGVALAPAMPSSLPGTVLLLAGLFQCSAWKARMLACCRASVPCDGLFLRGVRLGLHCNASCAGATSVLLALGVMDLCTMAAVTAAITAERLAPAGMRVAQVTGVAAIVAGLLLLAS
jgi:predicted metal-binding membrane protein